MFLRIFIGVILCAAGYYMVRKPVSILDLLGYNMWAEKYFPGGSQSFYKMVGIVLILAGFLIFTNLHVPFVEGLGKFLFG